MEPGTAELGSGKFADQLILVATRLVGGDDAWRLGTALHRQPDGTVEYVPPWIEPFLAAGAELPVMWRYLYDRVVEGRAGNGYSFWVEGLEIANPKQIDQIARAHDDRLRASATEAHELDPVAASSTEAQTIPREDAVEQQPPNELLSWKLAAELAARLGDTYRLEECHGGGGLYDELYFRSPTRHDVSLNRHGSVFVMTPEPDRVLPWESWASLHDDAVFHTVVERIVASTGGDAGPMRGAAVVAVIAAVLALPQAAENGWRCRWYGGASDEVDNDLGRPYADQDLWLAGDGWRSYWFLTDGLQRPVAAFDLDGYVYVPGRQAVELDVSYPDASPEERARRLIGGT